VAPQTEFVRRNAVSPRKAPIGVLSRWDVAQHALDVAIIAGTAPIWGPVVALLLALKRLVDGPAVLFRHARVGLNGRNFILYKIRTTPAHFRSQPEDWPGEDFPPRTRFGRWLRRCDLDELPQLWNVLKGDMSLVGPRPETPYHSANFAARLPRYVERCRVRPGLTGLAQLRGLRGDTDVCQRLAADLEYVSGRGFRIYTLTLIRTLLLEMRQARGA
jgi:lipopolysaccharide/colanic/teichoic acid biosynthesis glycosyltransferase